METSEIRKRFINFYTTEGYRSLPRASMIDPSIPMSFVMSAGLVQVEQSLARTKIRDDDKFVLVQDCFRHFDLDKVGTDDIHLSIFEMPGAFRFGPNGEEETVQLMWELATSELGIDKNRLWASYFRGGKVLGNEMPEDSKVRDTWFNLGLPYERIVGLGEEDNYWLQGKGFNGGDVVRKSGPNTELFFDRGMDRSCGIDCQPSCKCGRFIEFSNSLFIRYEVDPKSGQFKQLDDPFSETVVGSERVVMILQNKESVFEIDNYAPLIQLIRKFSETVTNDSELRVIGECVIADHLRALVYLISDDAPPPGKNGQQRLIKKLLRGLVTGMQLLEISNPEFLDLALECVVVSISNSPIVGDQVRRRFFSYYAMQEETFLETIEKGKKELVQYFQNTPGISGEQILFLEKKMGLPYLLIARELSVKNIPFPEKEYGRALINWKDSMLSQL
jgi:alanyl-tRNA synthetase